MAGALRACCFGSAHGRAHRAGDRLAGSAGDAVGSWCAHGTSRAPGGRLVAMPGRTGVAHPGSGTGGRPLLVYVLDVYDPRAYQYQASVSAVLRAACSDVDVEVVQSGRVATPRSAAGVIALLAGETAPVGAVLEAVQDEFFVGGRSLDQAGVLGGVAERLGLDGPAVELFAGSARAAELALEDAELANDLDGAGGPLLIASKGGRVFEFDGPGATGERLVDQYRSVLARP